MGLKDVLARRFDARYVKRSEYEQLWQLAASRESNLQAISRDLAPLENDELMVTIERLRQATEELSLDLARTRGEVEMLRHQVQEFVRQTESS